MNAKEITPLIQFLQHITCFYGSRVRWAHDKFKKMPIPSDIEAISKNYPDIDVTYNKNIYFVKDLL